MRDRDRRAESAKSESAKSAVTIRPLEPSDASDLHRVLTQPGVLPGTLQFPSRSRAEVEKRFVETGPDRHAYTASIEGKVVGFAGLIIGPSPRVRHAADLWISVDENFQARGVGTALMHALCDLADRWLGLVRISLKVNADNAHAIRLYERFGFEHEGRARADALRDGAYIDSIYMGRVRPPPKFTGGRA
jgi:putative acetyltransferase